MDCRRRSDDLFPVAGWFAEVNQPLSELIGG